jgi:gluconokinase
MTLLTLDIGSSSVRALLFDETAHAITGAVTRRTHRFATDADGASTADPQHLRGLVEACIDELLRHPAATDIRAVGMATFVGNLLGIDATGQPITPVYTYADTRCAPALETLRAHIDPAAIHQRTGCPHHTAYHPAKLRWLHDAGVAAAGWLDFGTWLYRGWFGRAMPCSYSVAAWSGLLDRVTLTWDAEWLRLLDLREDHLPPLADYTATQVGLLAEYATRWAALREAQFFLAVGDGAAANVGAGALRGGTCALTIGTTAALRRIDDAPLPTVPEGCWSYRVDARRHLIGGATNEGGSTIAWVRDMLRLPDDADAQVMARPADAHGLTFLPLLTGERSPGYAANATGTLHGLRAATTPLDIYHAALDGVALRLALIGERLGVTRKTTIYASGGALLASPAWAQICADALDATLLLVDDEATARGVALLMLEALGDAQDALPTITRQVAPIPARAAALRDARARMEVLYAQMWG